MQRIVEQGGLGAVQGLQRRQAATPSEVAGPVKDSSSSQVTNASGQQPGGFRDVVELANAAYGQGETFVTPLQMAQAMTEDTGAGGDMTEHAERVFQRFTNASDDFPRPGTRWFRDWFYPLWRDHGGAQVRREVEAGGKRGLTTRKATSPMTVPISRWRRRSSGPRPDGGSEGGLGAVSVAAAATLMGARTY